MIRRRRWWLGRAKKGAAEELALQGAVTGRGLTSQLRSAPFLLPPLSLPRTTEQPTPKKEFVDLFKTNRKKKKKIGIFPSSLSPPPIIKHINTI